MAETGGQNGGEGHGPLHQFEITPLFRGDTDIVSATGGGEHAAEHALSFYTFTNSSLAMLVGVVAVVVVLSMGVRRAQLVPTRLQSLAEISYEFIANMIRDNVGTEGRKYFGFIFALFMFVFAGNMLGLIPYSFTYTSHIVVTFTMAAVVFVGVTVIGFMKHGLKFFGFFLPKDVPIFLAPLLIPIEVLSYFTRPVSLSLRLFANMTAGHTMLKVFAGFVGPLGAATFAIGGIIPLALVTALTGLEFIIAFLQAYVFAILSCVYLHDALHMH